MMLVKHLIGKGVTDSNGECSVVYDSNHTGTINIKSESKGLEANTTITVRDDLILLTGTDKIIQTGDTTTLTAKLPPKPGTVIEDQTIYLSKNVDSTDWSLNLTASKEIIQVGETTTLTMLVKDSNDNAKENIILNLYKVDDSMAKELVATLVTDSTGMASYNYVGVGAGLLGFIAESGSLLSEIYSLIDALFYDSAIKDDAQLNNNWINSQSTTVTRGTDGTTISNESYATYFADNPSISAEYDWTAPFVVEVFIVSTNGQANNVQIYDGVNNSNGTFLFSDLNITGNNTLKAVCNGSSIKVYVDGVEKTSSQVTATFDKCRCGLVLGNGGTIKYKDFRIYPI